MASPPTDAPSRRPPAGAPTWLALAAGVAAIGLGIAITAKPFTSLGVLVALVAAGLVAVGVGELAGDGRRSRLIGIGWIAAGVAVAAWPGLSIRGLAVAAGAVLLVGGIVRIAAGVRGDTDERIIAVLSGLARAIFGALALAWPDVTLLVVAVLVGPALIVTGAGLVASAVRPDGAAGRRRLPRWMRAAGVAAALVVALALLAVSAAVHRSTSEPDDFYASPADPPAEPGRLVRSEPFSRGVPDGARAWRILYTTTRDDRTPALASGIVLVAEDAPAGPRPVVAWAHGTTGFAEACAPSVLDSPFTAGATPALADVVSRGWLFVAPDYTGLGTAGPHPYLIGEPTARSVLDAVRAARGLDGVDAAGETVVWGHSQGGGAALWTGIIAPEYAPDAGVVGVAALAPATRLPQIFTAVQDTPVGKILGAYVLAAYSATYPDVRFDDYLRPAARTLARETADRCLSGPGALVSVGTAVASDPWFSRSAATGALGRRLAENVPLGRIAAPVLLGQGEADVLVLPREQRAYVAAMCASGQPIDYRTYPGMDHVGLVLSPSSPAPAELVRWTGERFAGAPAPGGCRIAR